MALFEYVNEQYRSEIDVINLIDYVQRNSYFFDTPFSFSNSPFCLWNQMKFYKKYYQKYAGNLVRHFVLSFDTSRYENHVTLNNIKSIGYFISELFCEYQPIFGIHKNTHHWHLHIVVNTVNIQTGMRLHIDRKNFHNLNKHLAELLSNYKIALIPYTFYDERGNLNYGKVPALFLYECKDPYTYK